MAKISSLSTDIECDDNIISIPTTDDISEINTSPSTHISCHLFSQPETVLHEHIPGLLITKQNLSNRIHRSTSTSDCIDWTTPSLTNRSIVNQLNAIDLLQECLQNENRHVLIDLLDEIAREMNAKPYRTPTYAYSALNNNHFHLSPTFNSNLQLSNNKEKKNKKKKSEDRDKKDDKKKDNNKDEMTTKKSKKSKEKSKKNDETTTTDSEVVGDSPVSFNPKRGNHHSTRSPVETIGLTSLSIPVPQSGESSTASFMSPDRSRSHIPQQFDIAYRTQVQQQLPTALPSSSFNKTPNPLNISVQQQLQSLSQMARDGDEILITLSINALTQKQQMNTQPWNRVIPSSSGLMMPRNLELVAKGFARVQNEHPQLSPLNTYAPSPPSQQQFMMHSHNQPVSMMMHPSFPPRYPIPCNSTSGPPVTPIGPPIQPIFAPPNTTMSGAFVRTPNCANSTPIIRNSFDAAYNRSHLNIGKCDYLCQSSLYQPDFRGRPSPDLLINPYFPHSSSERNYSAKQSSKHRAKGKSKPQPIANVENITRTYSSIY